MDRDVAVLVLADRAAMLSLNTWSLVTFLDETRLINDPDVQLTGMFALNDRRDLIAHRGMFPIIVGQEFLQCSRSDSRIQCNLFNILAFQFSELTLYIGSHMCNYFIASAQ
jgi:hypothetical protein